MMFDAGFCLYSNAKIAAQKGPGATLPTTATESSAFSQEKLLEVGIQPDSHDPSLDISKLASVCIFTDCAQHISWAAC